MANVCMIPELKAEFATLAQMHITICVINLRFV